MVTDADHAIWQEAIAFAKKNKKKIAKRLTDTSVYTPEEEPVSVFMAGSPGAGKTEASRALIARISDTPILRIDPDELRSEFKGYNGSNSNLFQGGVSLLTEKLHDFALKQSQSFILDGTLSNFDKAVANIDRSLGKDRFVQILYVYQQPILAWNFVCARKTEEGRVIPPKTFIEQYFMAREVVNSLKMKYRDKIEIDLLLKNTDGSDRWFKANVDSVDNHIPEKYTNEQLEADISE